MSPIKTALLPLACAVMLAALVGCGGVEQATEDPPGRGESFADGASPAPATASH